MSVAATSNAGARRMRALLDGRIVLRGDRIHVEMLEILAEFLAQRGMRERILHRRLQVTQLTAAVITLAGEAVRVHGLLAHQRRDTVSESNLAARALPDFLQVLENRRGQN